MGLARPDGIRIGHAFTQPRLAGLIELDGQILEAHVALPFLTVENGRSGVSFSLIRTHAGGSERSN